MDTAHTENTCTRCRHLVLTGVACDWQPETCPYAQASHQAANNSQHSHSRVLAAAGEYDAIKSNN